MFKWIKGRIKTILLSLLVTLPLSFVVLFFGLMPLRFDAVMHFDNIVGEGTCSSFLTDSSKSFSYLYQGGSYFGSELKTLRLADLSYNVEEVGLYIYDVESADLLSYDIVMFGRVVTHEAKGQVAHPYTRFVPSEESTGEEVLVHLAVPEGEEQTSIGFPGSTVIPAAVWITYFAFIFLVALLLAIGLAMLLERAPGLKLPLLRASCLIVVMLAGCYFCDSLPYVDYIYFLLNWLLFLAAAMLINSLTLPWIGTSFVSVFALLWYVANYFVIKFRDKPVMPADLKAIGTAREVIGGYDLTPSWAMVVGVLVTALWLTLFLLIYRKNRPQEKAPLKKQLIRRGFGVAAAIVLVVFGVNNNAFASLNEFQWDAKVLEGFHREGILLTYVKGVISSHVDKPEGYSREAVDAILAEYQPEADSGAVHPTRIIMIMNEAFSDLRTVGLDPSIDVMPFIDSLDANTIEGRLYVSIIGGGTCNTEFEALTGNTLAFLGTGAYPYTENVTKPTFSLASYFRDNGYVTEAFHASEASNWNRDTVYDNLGFDLFHSFENYPSITGENIIHSYVSDATDYAFIEQRDAECAPSPRFLFNVTIQNHAFYDHFENVPLAETLKPYADSLAQDALVYLSLIKVSDDAVRQLVEQYRNSDEPTMIVFFGDHQPALGAEATQQIYSNGYYIDSFQTKFFIWTNYETETVHNAAVSANYLPWLILERGNFPLPPYVQLLKEVHEKYPVLSSQGLVDADGYMYDNVAVLPDDPLLQKYRYVQYAILFDELDPAWFEVN